MGFRFPTVTAAYRFSRNVNRSTSGLANHIVLPLADHQDHFRIIRRWHMGGRSHSHQHLEGSEGDVVFKLGLAADIALAAGKAMTGYLSGSTAIIADAAHSVSDIVLSSVALWSFRAARAPKDNEHPYELLLSGESIF